MKQEIQTQLLNLSEEKQKELYELTVAVRTQLAKENKNKNKVAKNSLKYLENCLSELQKLVKDSK